MPRLTATTRIVVASCCILLAAGADGQVVQPPRAEIAPLRATDGVHPGGSAHVAIHVRLPEGLHMNSNAPRDPSLIQAVLGVDAPPGVVVAEIVYPQATDLVQLGAALPLAVYEREFTIGVRLDIDARTPPGTLRVPARLRYQACDERVCYFPATVATQWDVRIVPAGTPVAALDRSLFQAIPFGTGKAPAAEPVDREPPSAAATAGRSGLVLLDGFTIAGTTGGYLGRDDFLAFIERADAGIPERGWFEGRGLPAILAIVLVGGLALNLTPCVLPMIPINLAVIGAGARAGSRRRGFLLGSAYGAAMAVVYGVLGLVVILTTGTFGTLNASPWFNLAIAAIFIALALAMFDVVTIDFSRYSTRFATGDSGRGTFLVAFGMGAVGALLAGACVAPVVIQVVLFSSSLYASGTTAALALPFLLGVGMAAPWPVAGAGLSALPKPGAWMVRVTQAFGVLILATAVYYGYVGYTLLADRWVDASAVRASVEQKLKEGWHASLADGLVLAERERKPVLVDLWATWCKNCLTMDRTTLKDPAVTGRLEGYVKVKFQAEDPDDPVVNAVMKRFGAVGLPAYVVLKPRT
jgi:cytochrome c biogenesis protein CcdA